MTGSTYTLEVDGVGLVSGVAKADMLPVEYEDDEGGGGGGGEEEEGCDDELLQMLESLKFESLAPKLAAAGIRLAASGLLPFLPATRNLTSSLRDRTVDDVKDSDDKALKDAGVASNLQVGALK